MIQPDDGFVLPNWTAPLDAAALIAQAPEDGRVKGLFFQDVVDRAGAPLDGARPKYQPFIDYPLREFMELVVASARRAHPREPLRSGLRLIGRGAYPVLASTLIGKTIFGLAGKDFGAVLEVASRGYAVSGTPGTAALVERHPGRARVVLRQIWAFPDSYHVGVFEGALEALHLKGEIKVRSVSPCDADFELTWAT